MPKRKVRQPVDRTKMFITILTNLNILHSPCASEGCTVTFKHCSGCNESFPCKTAQVLAGKTVNQLNADIDAMSAVTLYGDQYEEQESAESTKVE
jgi:hypothetical protein